MRVRLSTIHTTLSNGSEYCQQRQKASSADRTLPEAAIAVNLSRLPGQIPVFPPFFDKAWALHSNRLNLFAQALHDKYFGLADRPREFSRREDLLRSIEGTNWPARRPRRWIIEIAPGVLVRVAGINCEAVVANADCVTASEI